MLAVQSLISREQFLEVKKNAQTWVKNNPHKDYTYGMYCLIRSRDDQDFMDKLKKAFSPVTNPVKRCNGQIEWQGIKVFLQNARMIHRRNAFVDSRRAESGAPRLEDYYELKEICGPEPVEGFFKELAARLENAKKVDLACN